MSCDPYIHTHSLLHRWDTRWKIASITLCVFACAYVRTPRGFAGLSILVCAVIAASRIPIRHYASALRYPAAMLIFVVPLLSISSGGHVMYRIGALRVYHEGLLLSCTVAARSLSVMVLVSALFMSSRPAVVFKALERLRTPHILVLIFQSTYRFIFLFRESLQSATHAARLRGHGTRGFFARTGTLTNIIVLLLVRGFEQTERTARAMKLRGLGETVVLLHTFRTTATDVLLFAAAAAASIALIVLEYT